MKMLTPREEQVLALLARGLGLRKVALELDIELSTARKHKENVMKKLDLHSTAQLVLHALRIGLNSDARPEKRGTRRPRPAVRPASKT